jgi:3-dehydroquinate synthetase
MANFYEQILQNSVETDNKFQTITNEELQTHEISFKVPQSHPRSKDISGYDLKSTRLTREVFEGNKLIICDPGVAQNTFVGELLTNNVVLEQAREDTFKELTWLRKFAKEKDLKNKSFEEIIAIGGGLTLNVASYLAELLELPSTQIPTSVISMADGSGGKVRINLIDDGKFYKHFIKSFYEPDRILFDNRFLDSLTNQQVSSGLSEIIKHGIYQSKPLLDYITSEEFDPYNNKQSLLKAILWTANLKNICMKIDVEENENGSSRILRGGHVFSDRIEEETNFGIPHGIAVAIGLRKEMELADNELLARFMDFCKRFDIPTTVNEAKR